MWVRDWSSLISHCTKRGELRRALTLYQNIPPDSMPLDGRILVSLMNICGKLKDVVIGCELHAEVYRRALLESDVFVGSALVDMYAKCGFLREAQEVFHELPVRNVVTWNALISGLVQHGHANDALESLQDMQFEGVCPDGVTLTCSLKACGIIRMTDKSRGIHADIVKLGILECDPYIGSALINTYADCNFLAEAYRVFDNLLIRDVVTWNTLISRCLQHEYHEEALDLFEQMQLDGIAPSPVTYACSLKACGSIRAAEKGRKIHADIVEKGLLQTSPLIGNTLVEMYAKCGILSKAQEVFDTLTVRNVVTWTALMGGYAQGFNNELVLQCWESMQLEGISPDAVTFACVLKTCGSIRHLDKGIEIHKMIAKNRLLDAFLGAVLVDMYVKSESFRAAQEVFDSIQVHDTVIWNTLIAGHVQENYGEVALKLFQEMKIEGALQNSVTFSICLDACKNVECMDVGRTIHAEIFMKGLLDADSILGCALIDMYVDCGSIMEAQHIFYCINVQDVITWNVLMAGYVQQGHFQEALTSFYVLQHQGICPDALTFVYYLKACSCTSDVVKAREMHARIAENAAVIMDPFIGSALVDMYARFGWLAEMQEAFNTHPIHDVVVWNALITAFMQHVCYEQALCCFQSMKLQGISPNAVTYACCLKACSCIGSIQKTCEIHAAISVKDLLMSDHILGIALVDAYAKLGMLLRAWELLHMLPVHSVVLWTVLITGCVQHKYNDLAFHSFKQMQLEGVPSDAITLACALKACDNVRAIRNGNEILDEIMAEGIWKDNQFLGNMLIDIYAKCGMLAEALKIFDGLLTRDVVTWTTLIEAYVQRDSSEDAVNCICLMQREGIAPNAVTVVCCLEACGVAGLIKMGSVLHTEFSNTGLLNDVFVGSAVVDMYAKCGFLVKAEEVFDVLPARNTITWNALISGFARLGEIQDVLKFFSYMSIEGVVPDRVTFTNILKACSHAGELDRGHMYFEAMNSSYGITPGLNHHTCIVDILGRAGQLCDAVEMMTKVPFHPDSVMSLALLSACRKWGEVELGRQVFEETMRLDERRTAAYISMHNIYADAGNCDACE